MNHTIEYKLYDDYDGKTWAAVSESHLHAYDAGDVPWGEVSWPVRELTEAEIDSRTVDITSPDASPDDEREIISLREFMLTNINSSRGVQLVCIHEIWDIPTEPDAPFCGCGD